MKTEYRRSGASTLIRTGDLYHVKFQFKEGGKPFKLEVLTRIFGVFKGGEFGGKSENVKLMESITYVFRTTV